MKFKFYVTVLETFSGVLLSLHVEQGWLQREVNN